MIPRFYSYAQKRTEYESKILQCNEILADTCEDLNITFIRHNNITQIHYSDGIHLNLECGVPQYVQNLKQVINPLVGVKKDENSEAQNQTPRMDRQNPQTSDCNRARFGRNFNTSPNYRNYGQPRYPLNTRYTNYQHFPNDSHYNGDTRDDINIKLLRSALQGLPSY